MAKGKINLQANDGAVIGLVVPDGLMSGERQISLGSNLSGITAYHLLGGNLSVDNTVLTNGFGLYLYTGNTTILPTINLGMDITSQWGNAVDETYGYLIKIKSRSAAGDWTWVNSVRGSTKYISSNTTAVEGTDANMFTLSTVAGVTTLNIGTSTRTNTNGVTYVVEIHQTTHRKTGITNQGKTFTEHYNPDTGFTINNYEGSGLSGHDIPHSLGRMLGFVNLKCLTNGTEYWQTGISERGYSINSTNAFGDFVSIWNLTDISVTLKQTFVALNASTNQYIMFGYSNSYFDEANKLIGNYEIGVYQGSSVVGNKVKTKGKPAWIMIKRLDVADNWLSFDNMRNQSSPYQLYLNSTSAEITAIPLISFVNDGFILTNTAVDKNASGGQYLYIVVYDNDNGSGKSKYYKATDTANVQINNALIPLAHGIDSNGSKNSIVVANETITGVTYTEGKNYLYKTDTGYGVTPYEPRYLASELIRTYAGEQPDYFDVEKNKWFNTDAGDNIYPNASFVIVPDGQIGHDNGNGTIDGYENLLGGTASIENGRLKVSGNQWATARIQLSGLVAGKRYKFVLGTIEKGTATSQYVDLVADNDAKVIFKGNNYAEFIPNDTTKYIRFVATATAESGVYAYFDNISVFEVEITPTTEISESRNYMNHVVRADADGGVLYVEELPKVKYENIVKAEEFIGKNVCTARVNSDGTTTPPTIKDSFNVSTVIRTTTSTYDIYFNTSMDNLNYSVFALCNGVTGINNITAIYTKYLNKVNVIFINTSNNANLAINPSDISIHIDGGRN